MFHDIVSVYNYFPNGGEDILEEHQRRVHYQVDVRRRLRDTLDPFDTSVEEFMRSYRLPQHVVFELADLLAPYMERRTNFRHIPLCCKVIINNLAFCNYLASMAYLQ